jgi:hypothetical protein
MRGLVNLSPMKRAYQFDLEKYNRWLADFPVGVCPTKSSNKTMGRYDGSSKKREKRFSSLR